ncbi:TD and POZ domain-containing protein 1 [Trichonephila inaurata madagascariensis]|uniref:TD and POZ domain-containing protein 1 n=1 Tax=Trichonephila inaurata madagascariensis TaxID=2747483 RepID=A0A8X6YCF0_9ARAC|nr:TD and POZ domain-containing protein 1 [Trichonephila inaurata madagascariensis]
MAREGISKKKCFTFTWLIENYSYFWQKNDESISSPDFIVDTMANTKWRLDLFPKGDEYTDEDFISFNLIRLDDCRGPREYQIFYELSFLGTDGSVLMLTNIIKDSFWKDSSSDAASFVKREVLKFRRKEFLPEDVLTTRCRMWKSIGQVERNVHCYARTRLEVERRSFLENIKQFSTFQKRIHQITSVSEGYSILTVKLFSSGGRSNETFIRVEVHTNDQNAKFSTFRIHLLDTAGNRILCLSEEFTFDDDFETALFTLTFSKEKLMQNKDLYLPNDVLTLHCEYAFSTGNETDEIEYVCYGRPPIQEENLTSDDSESKDMSLDSTKILKENLESSYMENLLCDTKLKTKTGSFPAHKYILSARSPVFKAMFTNDMRERNSECVNIEDLNDDTVQSMLLYMYTATLPDLQWDSACNLFTAADKYEILSLKSKCSSFLKGNLTQDNALNLLILTDMHQDEDLKSAVQDYILNHTGIFNTNEWKLFMKTNVDLAADLMYLKLQE